MQLAEVLASRSRSVSDDLFASGTVPPICALLSSCSIARPAPATPPAGSPAADATPVMPPQLPQVLRALRALRYLASASDGRRTAASDLLRHGVFPALCRLLVQAAALADTDEGSVPEHTGSDDGMAKAAAVDAGCISDAQVCCCQFYRPPHAGSQHWIGHRWRGSVSVHTYFHSYEKVAAATPRVPRPEAGSAQHAKVTAETVMIEMHLQPVVCLWPPIGKT